MVPLFHLPIPQPIAPPFQRDFGPGGDPPAVRVGADKLGTVAIDFGLYGVPETYALDAGGVVRRRWVGAVTTDMARNSVLPLLRSLG